MALHTNPKVRVRAFGKKKVTYSVPWEAIFVILLCILSQLPFSSLVCVHPAKAKNKIKLSCKVLTRKKKEH